MKIWKRLKKMRIIKHGNKYEIGQITCDRCECTFAYTGADLKDDNIMIKQTVVICPECRKRLEVHLNVTNND